MNIPKGVAISDNLREEAEKQTSLINAQISQLNLIINPSTKTATYQGVSPRSSGKTAIEYHWVFVKVYLSSMAVQLILAGGLAAISDGTLAVVMKLVSRRVIVIVAAMLGVGVSHLNSGIWFDYNFVTQNVTACGFQ